MAGEEQPRGEHPSAKTPLGEGEVGTFRMIANVEKQHVLDGRPRGRMNFSRFPEQVPTHVLHLERYRATPSSHREACMRVELTVGRTNRVTGALSLFRKEIGNREVALSGIVIEGEDAGPFAELRQLLRDTRKRGARGDADQQSFLARGTTRHLFRLVRVDVDDTIEDLSIEDARDEVGA